MRRPGSSGKMASGWCEIRALAQSGHSLKPLFAPWVDPAPAVYFDLVSTAQAEAPKPERLGEAQGPKETEPAKQVEQTNHLLPPIHSMVICTAALAERKTHDQDRSVLSDHLAA
jgi:hypothetical protein